MPAWVSAEAMPIPAEPGADHDHAVRMLGHGPSSRSARPGPTSSPGAGTRHEPGTGRIANRRSTARWC